MTTAYGPYIRIISVSHKPTGPIGVYQVFKSLPNDPRLVRTWRGFLAFIKAFQMNHQLRWSPTWIWRRLWGNFPPDVIILLYGGCFFFDILSQLGSIGAPFGMAFIWPARTARFHPPNMMIVSKTSQMTALNGLWSLKKGCNTKKVSYVVCSFWKKCLRTKSVEVIRDENPPRVKGQTLLKCTQIILCSVQNGF